MSGQALAKFMSWNISRSAAAWSLLDGADDMLVDLSLLQEACAPPATVTAQTIPASDGVWETAGEGRDFCAAIVRLTDRVHLEPWATVHLHEATSGRVLPVSRPGTIAVASVEVPGLDGPLLVASAYGAWERPVPRREGAWIYADASAHRIISDLSAVPAPRGAPSPASSPAPTASPAHALGVDLSGRIPGAPSTNDGGAVSCAPREAVGKPRCQSCDGSGCGWCAPRSPFSPACGGIHSPHFLEAERHDYGERYARGEPNLEDLDDDARARPWPAPGRFLERPGPSRPARR